MYRIHCSFSHQQQKCSFINGFALYEYLYRLNIRTHTHIYFFIMYKPQADPNNNCVEDKKQVFFVKTRIHDLTTV